MNNKFPIMDRLPMYPLKASHVKTESDSNPQELLDFGMGNPDLPPAPHIVEELIANIHCDASHRYAPSAGIPDLKKSICKWYRDRYGVVLDPETESIVTIGSKEGIAHLSMATVGPTDSVIVPDPTYPVHTHAFTLAGARVIRVPMANPDEFLEEVKELILVSQKKPKIILVNFPANPTGLCVDLQFYEKLVAIARQHNIWVIQDFAYADIAFDGYVPPSILQVEGAKEVCVEFFSLSKSYNMPGYRVGFMCGNAKLVKALAHIKSYLDYGMYLPIQAAAQMALQGPQDCVKDLSRQYQRRRDCLCEGLQRLGWDVEKPKATMFVWAKIPDLFNQINAQDFSEKLRVDTGIIVTPGSVFGPCGEGYIRFSLITSTNQINKALYALKNMMKSENRRQKMNIFRNQTLNTKEMTRC